MAVDAAEFCTHERRRTASRPSTAPITSARSTPHAKLPTAEPKENDPAATARSAVRRSTRAVASFRRLSPSSIVVTRGEMPRRFAMPVATASVGLRIAQSATPSAKPTPGSTREKNQPRRSAVMTTRTTASPAIGVKSRRNSIAGSRTAAA